MKRSIALGFILALGSCAANVVWAQASVTMQKAESAAENATPSAPLKITLEDALKRAKENSPAFQASLMDYGIARQDRVQARAALLPSVNYLNQYLYTQGNGTPTGRYIANNAVHEYLSQGNVHEVLGLSQIADYRRSGAIVALTQARSEIAARGLVATVVNSYYALIASQRKVLFSQQALAEARHFLQISRDLEHGGEVAHADVIKAELQEHDRQRDVKEAALTQEREKLNLAILLFPNFNQDYEVVDDLQTPKPLPGMADVEAASRRNNPDLNAALAALKQADEERLSARGGYFPSLSLDYFYGIDATRFATYTDGFSNLGYSALATLNIPLFNWGATHSRVQQADLRRRQARRELSFTQRKLIADLHGLYAEAKTAFDEMELLAGSADLAQESLRLTTLRYQDGEATALEVVDAQNTLTQARNAYADGLVRYRAALANLQTLTGNF